MDSNAHLPVFHDRHNNFTFRITVTSDVAWKFFDIRHKLRLLALGSSTTYSSTKGDSLASDFALERPQDKLIWRRRIQHVEASPVYLITRRR